MRKTGDSQRWNACTDPARLLDMLSVFGGPRHKRGLIAALVACVRRVTKSEQENNTVAVNAVEAWAVTLQRSNDVERSMQALTPSSRVVSSLVLVASYLSEPSSAARQRGDNSFEAGVEVAEGTLSLALEGMVDNAMRDDERAVQCDILRDTIGDLFKRPRPIGSNILDANDAVARKLLAGIVEEQAFDRLPILADALEEAGCRQQLVLDHLRHNKPHVRGCWAMQLMLA